LYFEKKIYAELFSFRFEHIFDQTAKQDEVFEQVAQPVIDK
jgi:hypothetical protein